MTKAYNVNYWDYKKPTKQHNADMVKNAEEYAQDMRKNPSYLEKGMIDFLRRYGIKFENQKIFYIKTGERISRYFIADFYIPGKKIIIEVDGKFHKEQVEKDALRTDIIKRNFPRTKIIRWTFRDFDDSEKCAELREKLRFKSSERKTQH